MIQGVYKNQQRSLSGLGGPVADLRVRAVAQVKEPKVGESLRKKSNLRQKTIRKWFQTMDHKLIKTIIWNL